MKITLREIVTAIPALSKLATSDLSLKAAYRLKKNVVALQKEADFFSEERLKILKRNGNVAEDGSVSFAPGKKELAEKELSELLGMEVTTDAEPMELSIMENARLSVGDIEALTPFVEFVENE